MNKTELSQLQNLKKEIELIKNQIANTVPKDNIATDSVKGSSICFPYTEHSILITGVDYKAFDAKVKRLTKILQARIAELMDKAAEINDYIATIGDSEVRMILQCKYINGLTWEQIEGEIGMCKRQAQRKFKKWYESV